MQEFEQVWQQGTEEDIFSEMAFCLLTPQSKAKICWKAILKLKEKDLLLKGAPEQVEQELSGVRFKERKSTFVVTARKFFPVRPLIKQFNPPHLTSPARGEEYNAGIFADAQNGNNIYKCREWLVANVKGYGYKEASHFLRNIGFGENLTILDRHILKNLHLLKVIEDIPQSLTKTKYMQIEKAMKDFAIQIEIPIAHLDIVFWSKESGEIFK